jgi:hypothetical protein
MSNQEIGLCNCNNILSKLISLPFDNKEVSKWEIETLSLMKYLLGNSHPRVKEFITLTKQGYWRPEKGDPRGSATCRKKYQKEYINHILAYKKILTSLI